MAVQFQSTLPQGEWRNAEQCKGTFDYFNPHSRKGSDESRPKTINGNFISIHTPARGVTWGLEPSEMFWHISIHTPARGVTLLVCFCSIAAFYFNPHSRKGSDLSDGFALVLIRISIHTPARGVTKRLTNENTVSIISIHTPARGVTFTISYTNRKNWFQSTLPQGEWPLHALALKIASGISIHTPARGVTFWCCYKWLTSVISIHTPARGVTFVVYGISGYVWISIHTPARGVTQTLSPYRVHS